MGNKQLGTSQFISSFVEVKHNWLVTIEFLPKAYIWVCSLQSSKFRDCDDAIPVINTV